MVAITPYGCLCFPPSCPPFLLLQITAFMRFPQHLSASSSQFYPLGLTSKPFIDAWRVSQAGLPKGAPSVLSSRTDGAGSTHLTHRPRDLYRELEALEADADTVSCMVPATRAREGGARKDVQDDDGAGWGQAWVAVETDARADAAITRAGEGATEVSGCCRYQGPAESPAWPRLGFHWCWRRLDIPGVVETPMVVFAGFWIATRRSGCVLGSCDTVSASLGPPPKSRGALLCDARRGHTS